MVTQGAGVPVVDAAGPELPAETETNTPACAARNMAAVEGTVRSVRLPPME